MKGGISFALGNGRQGTSRNSNLRSQSGLRRPVGGFDEEEGADADNHVSTSVTGISSSGVHRSEERAREASASIPLKRFLPPGISRRTFENNAEYLAEAAKVKSALGTDEKERFKADLDLRPAEPTMEDYDRVPIEKFGEALLRGMQKDWTPDKPIGKTNEGLVTPIEFVPRPSLLGIGAEPHWREDLLEKAGKTRKRKYIRPGETREDEPLMLAARNANGTRKNIRSLDEKLERVRFGVQEGSRVIVTRRGPHERMKGIVVALRHGVVTVRLRLNREEVRLSEKDVALEDDVRRPRPQGGMEWVEGDSNVSASSSQPRFTSSEKSARPYDDKDQQESHRVHQRGKLDREGSVDRKKPKIVSKDWIVRGLRIRVTSTASFYSGRYYNHSGTITDVADSDLCSVRLDGGRSFNDVPARVLAPLGDWTIGTTVCMLSGTHAGESCNVVEIFDNNSVVVSLTDSFEHVAVPVSGIGRIVDV